MCVRYDEELALADAREREVKSRTGHRGKPKTEPRKPVSWKWLDTAHEDLCLICCIFTALYTLIKGTHAEFTASCSDTLQISQMIKLGMVGQRKADLCFCIFTTLYILDRKGRGWVGRPFGGAAHCLSRLDLACSATNDSHCVFPINFWVSCIVYTDCRSLLITVRAIGQYVCLQPEISVYSCLM